MDPNVLTEKNNKKTGRHRKKHLYSSILQQMEFYFSTSNLSKDRFLSQLIYEDPYVDLTVFLSFNKIKKLTENIGDIQKALGKSDLIELSEDKTKVRRKTPLKVKENVDECTIYVENIKSDVDHDWVSSVFSEFGNVVYVSIPKYKHSRANKGFAFVEFESEVETRNALDYFESIGCKMPSQINPEDLKSIATFEGDKAVEGNKTVKEGNKGVQAGNKAVQEGNKAVQEGDKAVQEGDKAVNEGNKAVKEVFNDVKDDKAIKEDDTKKRKLRDAEPPEETNKKIKLNEADQIVTESGVADKKKLKKEHKKKVILKEMGLQVLSKKEWKKMRNKYLDLQKKKMKEFKQHLLRNRFAPKMKTEAAPAAKFEFKPGLIVKIKLTELCEDVKKLKNEIKSMSENVQYVDMNLGQDVFVRFQDCKGAEEFAKMSGHGEKTVLDGEEERSYWEKITKDRNDKFCKDVKKQRGRDKLLKKAKEVAHHIRFDDND